VQSTAPLLLQLAQCASLLRLQLPLLLLLLLLPVVL